MQLILEQLQNINKELQKLQEQIQQDKKKVESYEALLEEAELITHYENEKIALGTKFILEFSDGFAEELTLVETNVGVSTVDGYLTLNSPIGQSVFGKSAGSSFEFQVGNEKTMGFVKEIIPQQDIKEQQKIYVKK